MKYCGLLMFWYRTSSSSPLSSMRPTWAGWMDTPPFIRSEKSSLLVWTTMQEPKHVPTTPTFLAPLSSRQGFSLNSQSSLRPPSSQLGGGVGCEAPLKKSGRMQVMPKSERKHLTITFSSVFAKHLYTSYYNTPQFCLNQAHKCHEPTESICHLILDQIYNFNQNKNRIVEYELQKPVDIQISQNINFLLTRPSALQSWKSIFRIKTTPFQAAKSLKLLNAVYQSKNSLYFHTSPAKTETDLVAVACLQVLQSLKLFLYLHFYLSFMIWKTTYSIYVYLQYISIVYTYVYCISKEISDKKVTIISLTFRQNHQFIYSRKFSSVT